MDKPFKTCHISPRTESNRQSSRLLREPFPNSVQRRITLDAADGAMSSARFERATSTFAEWRSHSTELRGPNQFVLIRREGLEPSWNLLGLYVQSVGCCRYTTCDQ